MADFPSSPVISTLDPKLVLSPHEHEFSRRHLLLQELCYRAPEDARCLQTEKEQVGTGFCSLITRVVNGDGKPLIWSLLLCITPALALMYFPVNFQWIRIRHNPRAGRKCIGLICQYPGASFQFSLMVECMFCVDTAVLEVHVQNSLQRMVIKHFWKCNTFNPAMKKS